jgi:hypothetical protein
MLLGAALGVVVLGLGGRAVTAGIAIVAGRETHLSLLGLTEVVLLGAVVGVLGSLLLQALRRPNSLDRVSRGLVVAAVLFFGSLLFAWFVRGMGFVENAVQPFTLIAVAVVFGIYGIALDAVVDRAGERARPRE